MISSNKDVKISLVFMCRRKQCCCGCSAVVRVTSALQPQQVVFRKTHRTAATSIFFVGAEPIQVPPVATSLTKRQNPTVQALFGELEIWLKFVWKTVELEVSALKIESELRKPWLWAKVTHLMDPAWPWTGLAQPRPEFWNLSATGRQSTYWRGPTSLQKRMCRWWRKCKK